MYGQVLGRERHWVDEQQVIALVTTTMEEVEVIWKDVVCETSANNIKF